MTKRERETLREAVRLIWQDDFEAGMRLLLPLAGMRVPAWDAADKATPITLKEIVTQRAEVVRLAEIEKEGSETCTQESQSCGIMK